MSNLQTRANGLIFALECSGNTECTQTAKDLVAEIAALKDELAGTIKVREQAFAKIANLTADLAAERDLVQRLFDSLSYEIVRREAGESMSQETAKKMQAQAEDEIHESYGFRKVAGKWERING